MDLDSFFVSVERLLDPSLLGKPVIVGGTGDRGVVTSCSYEARQFGVQSAMNFKKARALCPHGIYIMGHYDEYGRYSKMVTDIIAERAPLYEKASIDEFYVDLTGMDRFYNVYQWSTDLREKIIATTGLPISFGLSVNKMLAKMATNEAKPNGQLMIPLGKEQEFLDPLPVGKIPFCGEKMVKFLNEKGVFTIYQLRQFSPEALQNWMGKHGLDLWHRAHGRASTELHQYREAKGMSSERTFGKDTDDTDWLKKVIINLAEKLAFDLRGDGKVTSCVAIKLRYNDFSTHSKQLSIDQTSNSRILIEKALYLFDELYEHGRKVRLLGVRFTNLKESNYQVDMFQDRDKELYLYKAIDEMKTKYGNTKLVLAQNLNVSDLKHNTSRSAIHKDAKQKEKGRED